MPEILRRPEARLRKLRPVYVAKGTMRTIIPAIEQILRDQFGMDIKFLKIRSRKREIVYIRYAIAAILRRHTVGSFSEIGKYLNLDHSTIIYAEKQCNIAKQGYNRELMHNYSTFKDQLKQMGVI